MEGLSLMDDITSSLGLGDSGGMEDRKEFSADCDDEGTLCLVTAS